MNDRDGGVVSACGFLRFLYFARFYDWVQNSAKKKRIPESTRISKSDATVRN